MPRRKFHRVIFIFAGCYNLAWGIYSALFPQWFFEVSGMSLSNHPEIFICLAMVVGIYGLLYFQVARVPEKGWAIAAVGLLGKVLGPMGTVYLISTGAWPANTLVWLVLPNDLIWWLPFGLYLIDSRNLTSSVGRGRVGE